MPSAKDLLVPIVGTSLVLYGCSPDSGSSALESLPTLDPSHAIRTNEEISATDRQQALRQHLFQSLVEAKNSPEPHIQAASSKVYEDFSTGNIPVLFDAFNSSALVGRDSVIVSPEDHPYFQCVIVNDELGTGFLISFESDGFTSLKATALVGYIFECEATVVQLAYAVPLNDVGNPGAFDEQIAAFKQDADIYSWFLLATEVAMHDPESFPEDDVYVRDAIELVRRFGDDYVAFKREFSRR